MKRLLFLSLIVSPLFLKAQSDQERKFPLVVEFASFCCGTPDSKPVTDYVKCFRKKNKTGEITAYRIGPVGREGEYYLAFPLTELTQKQVEKFTSGIECIKILPGDKGGINYHKDFTIDTKRFAGRLQPTETILKL